MAPTHPREMAKVSAKGIAGAEVVETGGTAGAIAGLVGWPASQRLWYS